MAVGSTQILITSTPTLIWSASGVTSLRITGVSTGGFGYIAVGNSNVTFNTGFHVKIEPPLNSATMHYPNHFECTLQKDESLYGVCDTGVEIRTSILTLS